VQQTRTTVSRVAGDFDYEANGQGYSQQRRTDPKIAAFVYSAIGSARTVLNVGAGTGSYEPEDRYVLAVEPSPTMRAQRSPSSAPAISGVAEDLPLDDQSVDASMALITIHQWKDLAQGLNELRRVTRGSIVVLTFDGEALEGYWLTDYAPELIAAERRRYPSIDWLCTSLGGGDRRVEASAIPIPIDCTDGIIEAFYGRPERLLDDAVRRAQSSWRFISKDIEARFISRLAEDLKTGAWDKRYGALRHQPTYEGSLRLIVSNPTEGAR